MDAFRGCGCGPFLIGVGIAVAGYYLNVPALIVPGVVIAGIVVLKQVWDGFWGL